MKLHNCQVVCVWTSLIVCGMQAYSQTDGFELSLEIYTDKLIHYGPVEFFESDLDDQVQLRVGDLVSVRLGLEWTGLDDLQDRYPFIMGSEAPFQIFAQYVDENGELGEPVQLKVHWDQAFYGGNFTRMIASGDQYYIDTILFAKEFTTGNEGEFEYAFPDEGEYRVYANYTPMTKDVLGNRIVAGSLVQSDMVTIDVLGIVPNWDYLKQHGVVHAVYFPNFWNYYMIATEAKRTEISAKVEEASLPWLDESIQKTSIRTPAPTPVLVDE